jgi:hypothetical protein
VGRRVERQVEIVRATLVSTGYSDIPVHGALCMANGEGLPWIGHPRVREIAICRPPHIAKRLTAAGPLTADQIRAVQVRLEQALPPA